ncbi:D-alanyl-D-alaninecarboxypeptidase/D-alanyl-D-al anine-endopeptidase [[Leptolyngbya] sp. PCC 7376]|uniref:D-alanyl-D-alanine carboxypeptidase/D-alanyl-D-alanine endopeptidase n=1 Tax=[Leptolyngbya] sp. PCC 7376 TaxID=111781 RepID=UPI00029EDDE0|nr:D-alanyl-D-alanine carboxypeptidase/D-alanyl-D-alanine-endopeptidase [[Leptolyngbya] sp. PCC 7376]AFY38287.1 D-alanyl-D-alaninecarboxypeptidase/D-alanyl-D-al anine-endopeptidase [[Leptolyngbya] sp. PCC 7376]
MLKKVLAIAPCLFFSSVCLLSDIAVAQTGKICQLENNIAGILVDEKYSQAQWGIAVQDLARDELVYEYHADTLFVPASNAKLFTTAAALDILGTDHQFAMESYVLGSAPNLEALVIKGGGDPTLTGDRLTEITSLLAEQGVASIEQVVVDDSLFTETAIHPTWEWSDLAFYYGSPVNSLILDENAVVLTLTPGAVGQPARIQQPEMGAIALSQWRINNQLITSPAGTKYQGTITQTFGTNELVVTGQIPADANPDIWGLAIPNPAQNFLDQLRYELAQQSINVNRFEVTQTGFDDYQSMSALTILTSPTLPTILNTTNQKSNNLYAESLRHTLGTIEPDMTGAEAIATTLIDLGVTENSFRIKDGSGLSRHNLASPQSFTQLLDVMADHPNAEIYRNSLAIAAESGTLTRRFQDTPIAGRFYGKTGTMTNVVTLSGYLDLEGDRTLALSILVNQSPQSASTTRQGIDSIVQSIYHWGENCLGAMPTELDPDTLSKSR